MSIYFLLGGHDIPREKPMPKNDSTIMALSRAIEALSPEPEWVATPPKHKVYKLAADVVMEATIDDCHHHGANEWGILRTDLYTRHKMHPPLKWTKVNRVSYTPKRITMLARLIRRATVEARDAAIEQSCNQVLEDANRYGSGE